MKKVGTHLVPLKNTNRRNSADNGRKRVRLKTRKKGVVKHPIVVLLLLLGLGGRTHAASEPVTLTAGAEPVALAGHIETLRDDSGELTLDDVRSPKFADRFTALDSAVANFGFTHAAYWYRVIVQNPSHSTLPADWVLEVSYPVLDYLDFHLIGLGATTQTFLTGDLRQSAPGQLSHRHIAIPLTLAAGEKLGVYLRAQTQGTHQVDLVLRTAEAFSAHAGNDSLLVGLMLGTLVVMILYNLIIWLTVRDRAYFWYVLWIGALTGLWFVFGGFARQYGNPLFAFAPTLINISLAYLWGCVGLFGGLFFREFLQIRQQLPRLDRYLWMPLFWLAVIPVLLIPFIPYNHSIRLVVAYVILGSLLALVAAVHLARKGMRAARFFLLAFGIQLGAIAVTLLTGLIFLHFYFSPYVALVAAAFGVTVLSLALADRFNSERRENERLTRLKDFFAPQVAAAILDDGGASLLSPKRREVTVVFTDLRGFTALAAQFEPEDVIHVLRQYHEVVVETSAKHGGNVEHIAGDGVMVYFNAPIEISEPEARAVRMAFELRVQFEALCQGWKKRGHELGVGIGMACGFATVGAVGSKGRMDYSCIGTVTNLAARLCGMARHGQILAPQQFVSRVEALASAQSLGEQELKGMPKAVAVFNLAAIPETGA